MAERVLDENLSGEEIIVAVLDRLGTTLRNDCQLTPNNGYQTFSVVVHIALTATDVGRNVVVERTVGVRTDRPSQEPTMDMTMEIVSAPPNEVRVESGQPVPVETRDEKGKVVVKMVKYARRK